MTDPNLNALWSRAIVEELVHGGLTDACISPGSRSTPLTLAFAAHPEVRVHVLIDERVSAFYALGLAKAQQRPVALVCTSGSAGAHYHPAFVEATYANLPLIALTADRPQSLMHCGSGQTIEQKGMFGPHVRESLHLDLPVAHALGVRHVRAATDRLCAVSMGRTGGAPGPVHLNVPFEEPLAPTPTDELPGDFAQEHPLAARGRATGALIDYVTPLKHLPNHALAALADVLNQAQQPVIVCGPVDTLGFEAHAQLLELATAWGAPLLADGLSQMRARPHAQLVTHYDTILRAPRHRQSLAPDVVLRFGAQPTSKVYRFWRETHPQAVEILVDPYGRLLDPVQHAHQVLAAHPAGLIEGLLPLVSEGAQAPSELRAAWLRGWIDADAAAAQDVRACCQQDDTLWEGRVAHEVVRSLPEGATLLVASSMPVRDVDTFGQTMPPGTQCISNRGANGIDGLVATTLGTAAATGRPTVALLGDIATLHDASALLAAQELLRHDPRAHVTFVVVNNQGGGIFNFLPVKAHQESHDPALPFERLFNTPQQVDFGALAMAYGLGYERVHTTEAFGEALERTLSHPGVRLLEVVVEVSKQQNVALHNAHHDRVAHALDEVL